MLKKQNRLQTKEFQKVFKEGEKIFSQNFLLIFLQNKEGQKISVSIGKKNAKKAVERNFFRRKIYNILQENFFIVPHNFWAVLLITKNIKDLKNEVLTKEILFLLKKVKDEKR